MKIDLFKGKRFNLVKHALIIDETNKWIYFNIGRSGGTSVFKKCLEKYFQNIIDHPDKLDQWGHDLTADELKEYFSFTFVRNPFDRAVSVATRFKIMTNLDFNGFIDNIEKYVPHHSKIGEIKTRKDYDKLVIYFHAQPCNLYTHIKDECVLDFVGRIENVQEDFDRLCKRLNVPTEKVPHYHRSRDWVGRNDYRDYYDDRTREIVARKYKDDIRLFDYKF